MQPSAWIVLSLAALPLLAGCMGTAVNSTEAPPSAMAPPDGAVRVTLLLETLARLESGSGDEQAALVETARIDSVAVPTAGNRLRYALVLGTPGHAGFDPSGAQKLLQGLLAEPQELSEPEQYLATVVNRELESLLSFRDRLEENESAATRTRDQLAVANQRNESLATENLRLQEELDRARHKLEAIAELEKALSTRRVAPEGGS